VSTFERTASAFVTSKGAASADVTKRVVTRNEVSPHVRARIEL
jgi:hypothetical protein